MTIDTDIVPASLFLTLVLRSLQHQPVDRKNIYRLADFLSVEVPEGKLAKQTESSLEARD